MIKYLSFLVAIFLLIGCKNETKDFVKISGKLIDNSAEVLIQKGSFQKLIKVDDQGAFTAIFSIEEDFYDFETSNGLKTTIYLKNGLELSMQQQAAPERSFKFEGKGSISNNYIAKVASFFESDNGQANNYLKLNKAQFELKKEAAIATLASFKTSGVNDYVIDVVERSNNSFFNYLETRHKIVQTQSSTLAAGTKSPEFVNYENHKGGTTSLSDFRGKYVYIDIWATWCPPCKKEIPYLEKLEKELHDKNIEFVSISVDDPNGRRGSKNAWKNMVTSRNLSGTHLFADLSFQSDFISAFRINSIPRFILIDPKGNIVSANAKRPSNPMLKNELLELGI